SLDEANSLANQAFLLGLRGKRPESEETYKQAISLLENLVQNESLKSEAQFTLAIAERNRGEILWQENRKEDAAKSFQESEELLESLQTTPVQRYELAWLWLFCPDPTFQKPEQARKLAEVLGKKQATNGHFLGLWGISLLRTNQYSEAVPILKAATKLPDGDTPLVRFHLALALHLSEDHQPAQTAYETGLEQMKREQPGNRQLNQLSQQVEKTLQSSKSPPSE
ncbi:MAG: hypothetical protein KDA84_30685, partial [Planctomycetaceae bacterium]|nr:hypothetical protein [Planctomycetaceae bacterium]